MLKVVLVHRLMPPRIHWSGSPIGIAGRIIVHDGGSIILVVVLVVVAGIFPPIVGITPGAPSEPPLFGCVRASVAVCPAPAPNVPPCTPNRRQSPRSRPTEKK